MTTEAENNLARIVRQCLRAGVERHVDWAWSKYQQEFLELGKKGDKKLYSSLTNMYINYKVKLYAGDWADKVIKGNKK